VDANGDLTVGFLAQCSAILSLNADGVFALFGKGDIIEEEDAFGTGKGFGQVRAVVLEDLMLVPGALVDELLESLLGIFGNESLGKQNASREWFDGFAFAIKKKSLEVDSRPASRLGLRKVLDKHQSVITQPIQDSRVEARCIGFHVRLEIANL
jgi:hypothetical protein